MKHILSYNALLEHAKADYNPLSKLLNAEYTRDRRYVIVEGATYSCETGELISINEEWTWSEILHTGADVLSMTLDMIPLTAGSGAIVDILNTISYLIEAQFTAPEKRDHLYLMAGITFAFVVLPGPLQAASIPLKRWIKGGASIKKASPVIKSTVEFIGSKIGWIITEIPKWIKKALSSKLGNTLLGKYGRKVGSAVTAFTARLKSIFEVITGKLGKAKSSIKTSVSTGKEAIKSTFKSGAKRAITTILPAATVNLLKKAFAKKAVQKAAPEITERALRKLGLVPGQAYRYINLQGKATTATIAKVEGGKIFVHFGQGIGAPAVKNVSNFLENVIGAPWGRRGYTTAVPLFIKRFADMLDPNGDLSPEQIDKLAGLDPAQTSADSLAFLQEEVGSYEGDAGTYTVDQDVTAAQTALSKLGYSLAIDGKFGPETMGVLKQFQEEHGLSTSLGKLDNATMIKLKEVSGL
jgi:peptidoglycan hydrolase-like protein with peptidoglycan-binding domain